MYGRENLPADLTEDVLDALSMQALGQVSSILFGHCKYSVITNPSLAMYDRLLWSQCVEIQLGLAVDNMKATLAVKRRLACEQVKYWKEVYN